MELNPGIPRDWWDSKYAQVRAGHPRLKNKTELSRITAGIWYGFTPDKRAEITSYFDRKHGKFTFAEGRKMDDNPSKTHWYTHDIHTGWRKIMKAAKRRALALKAHGGSYLSTARGLQALSNVTKDPATKKKTRSDALYFYAMYRHSKANPMTNVDPLAIEAKNNFKDDVKAGHSRGRDYWAGAAGTAFLMSNPNWRMNNPQEYDSPPDGVDPETALRQIIKEEWLKACLWEGMTMDEIRTTKFIEFSKDNKIINDYRGRYQIAMRLLAAMHSQRNPGGYKDYFPKQNNPLPTDIMAGFGLGIGFEIAATAWNAGKAAVTGKRKNKGG